MSSLTSPSGFVTSTGGIRVVVASVGARRLTQAVAAMTAHSRSARRNTGQLLIPLRVCLAAAHRRGSPFPLLQLARELRNPFLDRFRMMHRAELRPTHPAELGALEVLGRKCLVVVFLRALRVQAQTELLLPVERVPRAGQRIIAIARTLSATCDISRMCGDLVGDHSLSNVFRVGKAEVLLWRYVCLLYTSP